MARESTARSMVGEGVIVRGIVEEERDPSPVSRNHRRIDLATA